MSMIKRGRYKKTVGNHCSKPSRKEDGPSKPSIFTNIWHQERRTYTTISIHIDNIIQKTIGQLMHYTFNTLELAHLEKYFNS